MNDATSKNSGTGRKIVSVLLRYVVPLVISAGLCWLLFRNFDFREMWHVIRTECDFRWVVPGLVLGTAAQIFRALRWQIQLNALGYRVPLFPLVLSMFGTYAVNLVFPRLGEIWRTGYVAQRQQAPFAAIFGSMVSDRLADTITVALLTLGAFALASGTLISYMSQGREMAETLTSLALSPWLWGLVLAFAGGLWWLVKSRTNNRFVLRIRELLHQLWQGFAVIVTMPGKGRWCLYTVGVWGCYFAQLLSSFMAFGFTRDVVASFGLTAVLVAFVVTSISMGVPSNGGIGPWQWAMMFALDIYGVQASRAAAFANFTLGVTTLLLIALGLFAFVCIPLERRRASRFNDLNNNSISDKKEWQK
ncbi:MAG: flippase-like domain-containing protein [Muribaculaceae bacterium]|nr:flippase-like domain-containing protein [Muribaculaceae bacterium]